MVGTTRVKFDRTIKKRGWALALDFSVTTSLEQETTLVFFVLMKNISTSKKELKKLLKEFLTIAKSMAKQAQLALKTKTQAKSNMYLYLLLTSLPPLKRRQIIAFGNGSFVQV